MSKKRTRQILAENVLRLRTENGWSQQFLADLMRVARSHVAKMESAGSAVTVDTIDKLADAFQITVPALLTEHTPSNKRA